MVIWKERLKLADKQVITMHSGAKILDVQVQKTHLYVWFLCDQSANTVDRTFTIYGTGRPIPDNPGEYIATFQLDNGSLVFHVFEEK